MKNFLKKYLPDPIARFYRLLTHFYRLIKSIRILGWMPKYNEDRLITNHYPAFMDDNKFIACYDSVIKKNEIVSGKIEGGIRWRAHTIVWAANRGKNLEGDFVECGVNIGLLSKIAMDYIGFKKLNKTFFLLDTYEGLVEKYLTESEKKKGIKAGGYEPCYEQVLNTFKDYKNVKIIKGPVPDTLSEVTAKKIAYLSIDMNCVIPEIAAAEYFWDKMISGAAMVLDDYGHNSHKEQQCAFDKFAKDKNVDILCLPTGQGLILKP